MTEAQEKVWNILKGQVVNFFGMDKLVEEVCTVAPIPGDELYLKVKAQVVVSFLEEILVKNYTFVNRQKVPTYVLEQQKQYVVIKKNPELEVS